MKILSRSSYDVHVYYRLEFDRLSGAGGFAFDCDEHGNVDTAKLAPAALENYQASLAGTNNTRRTGVTQYENPVRTPAVGECVCGAQVVLSNFTNPCGCGRDYNGSGQQLAPRQQWGEETGEHWTECF